MKSRLRSFLIFLAFVAAYFLISITYRIGHEEFVVDQCLSGLHGSFDYAKMSCDLEENHSYIPYLTRHPRDGKNFLLALISLVASLLAYRYIRTKNESA
jgi:hypothetical protein